MTSPLSFVSVGSCWQCVKPCVKPIRYSECSSSPFGLVSGMISRWFKILHLRLQRYLPYKMIKTVHLAIQTLSTSPRKSTWDPCTTILIRVECSSVYPIFPSSPTVIPIARLRCSLLRLLASCIWIEPGYRQSSLNSEIKPPTSKPSTRALTKPSPFCSNSPCLGMCLEVRSSIPRRWIFIRT